MISVIFAETGYSETNNNTQTPLPLGGTRLLSEAIWGVPEEAETVLALRGRAPPTASPLTL